MAIANCPNETITAYFTRDVRIGSGMSSGSELDRDWIDDSVRHQFRIEAKRLGWNVRAIIGNVQFAIETNDCTVVAERRDPRAWFEGHGRLTPWDPLQRRISTVMPCGLI